MCLTFYLRAGGRIRGKGAFSRALCAGLSATHTSELSASCTVTLHSVIDNTTFTFCLTNVKL